MTNTTNTEITTPKVWTVAKAGPFTGVASITGGGQWCVQDTTPADDLIGHRFTGDLIPVEIESGESLYVNADTSVVVVLT